MDPTDFFQIAAPVDARLRDVVQRELRNLLRNRADLPGSGCLISDIQNYLSLLVFVLPRLAERLLDGPHITEYINGQIDAMEEETDFSELDQIRILSDRQSALRCVNFCLVDRLATVVTNSQPDHIYRGSNRRWKK
jgi:hypothetical protein